jgi:hypothetical protein
MRRKASIHLLFKLFFAHSIVCLSRIHDYVQLVAPAAVNRCCPLEYLYDKMILAAVRALLAVEVNSPSEDIKEGVDKIKRRRIQEKRLYQLQVVADTASESPIIPWN